MPTVLAAACRRGRSTLHAYGQTGGFREQTAKPCARVGVRSARDMKTIAAIATGPAAGGIGVIRLSGPQALRAARTVAASLPAAPEPRKAVFSAFTDDQGRVLDEGLALWFPAPNSYTGEDVVELQAHGAPRLLQLLLEVLLREPGVRLAEPGEFTRRAYLNGRLALSRAEAVADLVSASSEAQVRAAAAQLRGGLEARLDAVRGPLVELRADLEASLDFPEESEGVELDLGARVRAAIAGVEALLADARAGAVLRRGARVVLYGPPNAGKSTLFNRLVGEARALVDAEPGTTRDALEAQIEFSGLKLVLVDTAGLRENAGRLEALGIERTRQHLAAADVAVLMLPANVTAPEAERWRKEAPEASRLEVASRADEGGARAGVMKVSGATGEGVASLRSELQRRLTAGVSEGAWAATERHLDALERARSALERALNAARLSTEEVVAGEVGLAVTALGELSGDDASVELVDAIFRRFCIGK